MKREATLFRAQGLGLRVVHRLLCVLWHESCWWLTRPTMWQLQLLFDVWFEHRGFSDNPLDHDADGPTRFGNQKDDAALKSAVAQGEGVTGAAREADPHAFARHFLQVRPRFGNERRDHLDLAQEHRRQLLNACGPARLPGLLQVCLAGCRRNAAVW